MADLISIAMIASPVSSQSFDAADPHALIPMLSHHPHKPRSHCPWATQKKAL
jgi:hypothetical protein